ncbi:MAG: IS200/IS605 family transposase [Calditrichaeota bacterium]|nr:IS200/IS605 family transposase [Calditrichota bacterium]
MSTYTQIYIHIVFHIQNPQLLLMGETKTRVFKYMTGIIKNIGHKPIIINGMPDHVHILVGLSPDKTISDLVKEVKRCSTNFINDNKFFPVKFAWQKGYGAFSYSRSHLTNIIDYIKNQKEHHRKKTFKEEYIEMLKRFGVDYDPKYIDL